MSHAPSSGMKTLLALVLLAGAALAQPPAKTADEMPASDVARWMSFFDKLVTAVVANEADCDKMAGDVSKTIDQNRQAIVVAKQARDANKKLPIAAQQKMLDGVKKMGPGIQKCGERDNVKVAFSKLDVSRK